jgi:hypothetical protein
MDIPLRLLPARLVRSDVANTRWFHRAAIGTTAEMVVEPDYWVNNGRQIKTDDKIEVLAEDGSFDMEVRVLAVDPRGLWAQVRVLRLWQETVQQTRRERQRAPDPDGYLIEYAGPHDKFRIIDRAGHRVSRYHSTEADAYAALEALKKEKAEVA